jgi:hypothetical protein
VRAVMGVKPSQVTFYKAVGLHYADSYKTINCLEKPHTHSN